MTWPPQRRREVMHMSTSTNVKAGTYKSGR